MKGRRGLWVDFITGIFIIGAVTIAYIILQQVYTYNIQPYGIREGSDTTNMEYIDIAWDFWPIPLLLGLMFSLLKKSRDKMGGVEVGE